MATKRTKKPPRKPRAAKRRNPGTPAAERHPDAPREHSFSLDVDAPHKVARVLERAAYAYWESSVELEEAWQDKSAGMPWAKLARIMEKAAEQAKKVAP